MNLLKETERLKKEKVAKNNEDGSIAEDDEISFANENDRVMNFLFLSKMRRKMKNRKTLRVKVRTMRMMMKSWWKSFNVLRIIRIGMLPYVNDDGYE